MQRVHSMKHTKTLKTVPEISWLSPVLELDVPADHKERIFTKTTLDQCRPSVDVAEEVIAAVEKTIIVTCLLEQLRRKEIILARQINGKENVACFVKQTQTRTKVSCFFFLLNLLYMRSCRLVFSSTYGKCRAVCSYERILH